MKKPSNSYVSYKLFGLIFKCEDEAKQYQIEQQINFIVRDSLTN